MFCSSDYFVLKVLPQIIEIITVTGNAYNKVTVHFRILLGMPESFSANNIELNMMTIKTEIASYESSKLRIALFIVKEIRREFLVQKCTAGAQMVNL